MASNARRGTPPADGLHSSTPFTPGSLVVSPDSLILSIALKKSVEALLLLSVSSQLDCIKLLHEGSGMLNQVYRVNLNRRRSWNGIVGYHCGKRLKIHRKRVTSIRCTGGELGLMAANVSTSFERMIMDNLVGSNIGFVPSSA